MKRYQQLGLVSLIGSLVWAIAPLMVKAQVPLTRADVESLANRVEVIPAGQSARPARLSDWLGVGDALRTAAAARAELRFNDGSLARIGERATFRFTPNTRNFQLSNGTVLFLIPPGRGRSTVETPSAITGIQGSAVVVRHIPFTENPATDSHTKSVRSEPTIDDESKTDETPAVLGQPGRTVVMVLTNNPAGPVEVTTANGTKEYLPAGYMAVVEGDTIQVMEFDLALFYQTSPLVEGLYLDDTNYQSSGQDPIDAVRQETLEGLASQREFVGGYLLNTLVFSSDSSAAIAQQSWLVPLDSLFTAYGELPFTPSLDGLSFTTLGEGLPSDVLLDNSSDTTSLPGILPSPNDPPVAENPTPPNVPAGHEQPPATPPQTTQPPVSPPPQSTPVPGVTIIDGNGGNGSLTPPGQINPTPGNTPGPGGVNGGLTPPGQVNPTPGNTPGPGGVSGGLTPPGQVNPTPSNTPPLLEVNGSADLVLPGLLTP
jgi:hypothetical protein